MFTQQGIGEKNCLQCHENGGYVERFQAYAPVTPHPDFINCLQCHVPKNSNQLFKNTNWNKIEGTEIHQSALTGSPPIIPHTLQLRENCLACHAGPSAIKQIRVTHPERVNCLQCHAKGSPEQLLNTEWKRQPKKSE